MLTLDKKLNYIESTASEVLAVYQSKTPVNVALADHEVELCEAYICVINDNNLPNIYAALATKSGRVFVYKPSSQPVDADYNQILQQAIDFVKGMGFIIEGVDLNYSVAMKTVVVRNIKVLRPPGTAARAVIKKRTTDAALLKGDKLDKSPQLELPVEGSNPLAVPPIVAAKEAIGCDDELAELQAEVKRLNVGKKNSEQAAASKLYALKGKLKLLDEEKKTLARALGDELAAVRAELALLVAEKARGEANDANVIASFRGKVAELVEERDEAVLRNQELSTLQLTTYEEVAKARVDLERVATELSVAAETITAQTEKSRLTDAELSKLKIEQARFTTELTAAAQREQELRAGKETLAEELAAMRIEVAEFVAAGVTTAAKEKGLATASEALATEISKMPEKVTDLSLEEQLSAAGDDEIFGESDALPAAELPMGDNVANSLENNGIEKIRESERQECNSEEGAVKETEQRRTEQQTTLKRGAEDYFRPPEADTSPGTGFTGADVLHTFPLLGEEQTISNAVTDKEDFAEVSFVLGTGVSVIEYTAAEDIMELYNSINVVRISPEAGKSQSSKAYICSVRKEGSTHVFIGLYLIESCRTLVYLHDKPLVGEAAYGYAISKAMEFVEAVGFMVGPVALDPVQLGDVLGRVPVLKRVKKNQGKNRKA